jgi:hypothetical protein
MNWKILIGLSLSLFIFGGEGFPLPIGMIGSFTGSASGGVSTFEDVMIKINLVLTALCLAIIIFGSTVKHTYFPVFIIITQCSLVIGLVITSKGNPFTALMAIIPTILTVMGALEWKKSHAIRHDISSQSK